MFMGNSKITLNNRNYIILILQNKTAYNIAVLFLVYLVVYSGNLGPAATKACPAGVSVY